MTVKGKSRTRKLYNIGGKKFECRKQEPSIWSVELNLQEHVAGSGLLWKVRVCPEVALSAARRPRPECTSQLCGCFSYLSSY